MPASKVLQEQIRVQDKEKLAILIQTYLKHNPGKKTSLFGNKVLYTCKTKAKNILKPLLFTTEIGPLDNGGHFRPGWQQNT